MTGIKPEDILADGVDTTMMNGMEVRKGTIAAFLANIEMLEAETTSNLQKEEAKNALQQLAPQVLAVGLHRHVSFKNAMVEAILQEAQRILSN